MRPNGEREWTSPLLRRTISRMCRSPRKPVHAMTSRSRSSTLPLGRLINSLWCRPSRISETSATFLPLPMLTRDMTSRISRGRCKLCRTQWTTLAPFMSLMSRFWMSLPSPMGLAIPTTRPATILAQQRCQRPWSWILPMELVSCPKGLGPRELTESPWPTR